VEDETKLTRFQIKNVGAKKNKRVANVLGLRQEKGGRPVDQEGSIYKRKSTDQKKGGGKGLHFPHLLTLTRSRGHEGEGVKKILG